MNALTTILQKGLLGLVAGAILGWFGGILFYELVSVPKAQGMNPAQRESFLCSEGQAPVAFALMGIVLGGVLGCGVGGEMVNQRKQAEQ